jgi:hypothetical protein
VAGVQGTGLLAGVLDLDAVAQRDIQNGFTGRTFEGRAVRTELGMGE